jgi:lysozyme family protein
MAQGSGPLAGDLNEQDPVVTSTVTPSFDMPDTSRDYAQIADTFDRLSTLVQPAVNELATVRGQKLGEAAAQSGQPGQSIHVPLPIGEAGQYLEAGFKSAYLASTHNQIDARADDLRAANQYDPDGFARAAQTAQSTFIQGAPDDLAVDVENYAQAAFNQAHMRVVEATEKKQNAQALDSFQERLDTLRPQLRDLAHDGQAGSADYNAKMTEVDVILGQMVANPAFALSPEYAVRAKNDLLTDLGSASLAGHVMDIYRAKGLGPALDELKLLHDATPSLPPVEGETEPAQAGQQQPQAQGDQQPTARSDQSAQAGQQPANPYSSLPDEIRQKGIVQATSELNQASAIDSQIANNASATQQQAEMSIRDQMKQDTASIALTGQGDPTLTEDAVRKVLGPDGVRDWLTERAKAFGDFRDYGDLSRLPPDQAAQRMAQINAHSGSSGGAGSVAPGFESAVNFVIDQNEGGSTLVANDNGRGPTKFGINQAANPGVDVPNLTRAQAVSIYRSKYWNAIGGDDLPPALALAAFDAAVNQGVGNAQKWLAQSGGDVTKFLALRRQGYAGLLKDPANAQYADTWTGRMGRVTDQVIGLTGGDPNSTAWSAWDAAQQQRRDDPAAAVSGDPFVKSEVAKWAQDNAAGKHASGSGFSAVQAYYDAETRAGIKASDQKPLPAQSLADYAGDYLKTIASNDPNRVIAWGRDLMQQFDDPTSQGKRTHGHQVFQAVLEKAGVSALAAQTAAAAVQNARSGQPASQQDQQAIASASRVDAMHRAANGTTGALPSILAADIATLRSQPTPRRRQQFDGVYGPGASARVLHAG